MPVWIRFQTFYYSAGAGMSKRKKICLKLISVIIICYVCSVRLLRLVTLLCVCIACSYLHFLIKSALLLACIFYHSWWIKDEYIYLYHHQTERIEHMLGFLARWWIHKIGNRVKCCTECKMLQNNNVGHRTYSHCLFIRPLCTFACTPPNDFLSTL